MRGFIAKWKLLALTAPPAAVSWLAAPPLGGWLGGLVGEGLDLALLPRADGLERAKFGRVFGGVFGIGLYIGVVAYG